MNVDVIALEDLRVDVVVGILEVEQRRVQPLWLDLELEIAQSDLESTARTGDLSTSINYANAADESAFLAQHGRWRLLESLGVATLRWLLAAPVACEPRAAVHAARWKVRKPEALGGLATPVIALRRDAVWASQATRLARDGATWTVLEQTPIEGAYRIELAPGATLALPWTLAARVTGGSVGAATAGAMFPRGADVTLVAGLAGAVLLAVGGPAL